MSGSDRDLDADQVGGRPKRAVDARRGDDRPQDEATADRATTDGKRGIDHVADKVKGLLRSGR